MEINKTGVKNKGGRPLKFKTEEELATKIEQYFKSCWEQRIDQFGNPVFLKDEKGKKILDKPVMRQVRPYTLGGLAVFLDCSRDTLVEYTHKKKFSDTLIYAKDRVYADQEERLFTSHNPTGTIFSLKNNYGWKDKTEVDNKHSGNLTVIEKLYPPSGVDN